MTQVSLHLTPPCLHLHLTKVTQMIQVFVFYCYVTKNHKSSGSKQHPCIIISVFLDQLSWDLCSTSSQGEIEVLVAVFYSRDSTEEESPCKFIGRIHFLAVLCVGQKPRLFASTWLSVLVVPSVCPPVPGTWPSQAVHGIAVCFCLTSRKLSVFSLLRGSLISHVIMGVTAGRLCYLM